ncbi:unnamed protein product, partial [Oppiella nova]
LDTLSIDGQLPFCSLTAGGHSTAHLPFESLSIASMMTSSEVSSVAPPRACALTPDPMNANFCPFLFDWRLFCERGQPRYVHAHPDGLRVDDCETAFLSKVSDDEKASLTTAISDDDDADRESPLRARSGTSGEFP